MKHIKLINHINGSYLKEQYLEAFLAQSAYIEGLLKLLADFTFWSEVYKKINTPNITYLKEVNEKIDNQSLYEQINFLNKTGLIKNELKQSLHEYRSKRNKVLHDLIEQMRDEEFEKELKNACDLGNSIINSQEFKDIVALLENLEKAQENLKNTVTESPQSNLVK